jgi:hypothetical protein
VCCEGVRDGGTEAHLRVGVDAYAKNDQGKSLLFVTSSQSPGCNFYLQLFSPSQSVRIGCRLSCIFTFLPYKITLLRDQGLALVWFYSKHCAISETCKSGVTAAGQLQLVEHGAKRS